MEDRIYSAFILPPWSFTMMPPGHIAATWGVAAVAQQHNAKLARLDYRLLAVCALLPDIIDKPLAILVFTDAPTSQLIAHSLLFNLALLIGVLFLWRTAVPYVLAFNAHLLADRMWNHTESFWWPIFGWRTFWAYKPMNTAEEMFNVYVDIITRYPQVWVVELVALAILAWFGVRYRLYQWPRIKVFLWTGRVWLDKQNPVPDRVKVLALSNTGSEKQF
jgi:hypothetical protein